jgi:hypothetical protein
MTDRTEMDPAGGDPPWSRNVLAEIARLRTSSSAVREALPSENRLGRSAWSARIRDPRLWRLAELQAVADVLGIPLARITGCE